MNAKVKNEIKERFPRNFNCAKRSKITGKIPFSRHFACFAGNSYPVAISNVMVGSLGDYGPVSNVVDIGPSIPSNYLGANQKDWGTYQVDITNVYYELVIPDIWIMPRDTVVAVGGSNVQFTVTGTNIPQGVNWSLIPDLSGSGGAEIQSNGAWQADVMPGNIGTNYIVRATSKDNTNFYDQVSLAILKVDIEQAETNVSWTATSVMLNLTADSYLGGGTADWSSTPSGISGSGTNITFNPSVLTPTTYVVRAQASLLTNCFDTCTVTVIKTEVTNIKFNHNTGSSSNDAINIRYDYNTAYDISGGEWIKGVTNIPVCYTTNKAVIIKVRLTIQPTSITNAEIWAVSAGSGGSLGNVVETNVTFVSGVASDVVFQVSGTTPNCVKKTTTDLWAWKIENINGSGSPEWSLNTSGVHTVYTILAEPVSPWDNTAGNQKNAWTKALDYSCTWADSEGAGSGCITKVTQKIYSNLGGQYDTVLGAPSYTDNGGTANFKLTTFLNAVSSANIGTVNCYDCGKSVVTFATLLGCNALYKYSSPFGYLNCIKPIGKGWANNPFYDNPSYTNAPVTGEDDDSSNGRSSFGNHAFGSISANIWDGCLKGNTGANPDTTNNVVETWMTGQSWNTYKTIVVDDVPATTTGSLVDYQFGIE